jgi:signal transduction histidine kinase
MKSRAWATWLIFVICAMAVIEGLGWVTWKALNLERSEREARAQAEFQERIRLALWRMESEITPIVAQESARPYFEYQSFYPAERAYTRMLQQVGPGEVMVPSPLLDSCGPYMRVHYQVGADGQITSPQAPAGSLRTLAESQYVDSEFIVLATGRLTELTEMIRPAPEAPVQQLAITPVPQAAATPPPPPMPMSQPSAVPAQPDAVQLQSQGSLGQTHEAPVQKAISEKEFQARQNLAQSLNSYQQVERRSKGEQGRAGDRQYAAAPSSAEIDKEKSVKAEAPPPPAAVAAPPAAAPSTPMAAAAAPAPSKQAAAKSFPPPVPVTPPAPSAAPAAEERKIAETTKGESMLQRKEDESRAEPPYREAGSESGKDEATLAFAYKPTSVDVSEVEVGPFQAFWRRDLRSDTSELFLERPVSIGGIHLRQGIWMDWPALKARLLATAADLLPSASLVPLPDPAPEVPSGQKLASFPVLLRPGAAPDPGPEPLLSAPHLTLGVTWLAVLGGVLAIGAVLRTSMELSDRRGRFVSAVTHELRTPLTTFRLYTGMLAGGMVADEAVKREYLATLESESGRLAGIVESVLEYAKLGGRPTRPSEPVSAAELLAQVIPSLERAAEAKGMTVTAEGDAPKGVRVRADPPTVERILLNLVDNSCKYAGDATDRRVHLVIGTSERPLRGRLLELSVRDHGPGIPGRERRRIFRAFHRAKRDQHGPHSGLGLGLALSRGLARELGGDLELGRPSEGTEVRLLLPLEPPAPSKQGP